jgi:hypothetical protein
MLPKHGVVQAVFLLAYAGRLVPRADVPAWAAAARGQPSFMAAAVDINACARDLIRNGLAKDADGVCLDGSLSAFAHTFDRPTQIGISHLLLAAAPPPWLWSAVSDGAIFREYIPRDDLLDLQWLEPDLDGLLLSVRAQLEAARRDQLRKLIGDAAELMLMAAYRMAGFKPVHVARLWDGYGYDIELPGEPIQRIEVKGTSLNTRGGFWLSRNEYEKANNYGPEWRLLQVVFARSAFAAQMISAADIEGVFALKHGALNDLVTQDTPQFVWMESAKVTAPGTCWSPAELTLDPAYSIPGFAAGRG